MAPQSEIWLLLTGALGGTALNEWRNPVLALAFAAVATLLYLATRAGAKAKRAEWEDIAREMDLHDGRG